MTSNTFIRAIEVWIPTSDRTRLTLKSGYYGEMDYFERVSRGMQFGYDEGLPGKAWASGHPLVLKDLSNSYFMRGDAAMTLGLSCAVAVPAFVDGSLAGVTVFFCADNTHHVGALEIWTAAPGEAQMTLSEGYFGNADKFEFTSRRTQFGRRIGLPGLVWDAGLPVIMDDLASGGPFLRADAAAKVGINRAVGFPCSARGAADWVMTFLSARKSPVAGRFEYWLPEAETGQFRFAAGYCEGGADLSAAYAGQSVPLDVGPLGEARICGRTVLCSDLANAHSVPAGLAMAAGFRLMAVMPVVSSAGFCANLVWYL